MSYAQSGVGGQTAYKEPAPQPSIIGTVTASLNDARIINGRLIILLARLRVSPPSPVKDTPPEQMHTLSAAAELVAKTQTETFELLNEIERFI